MVTVCKTLSFFVCFFNHKKRMSASEFMFLCEDFSSTVRNRQKHVHSGSPPQCQPSGGRAPPRSTGAPPGGQREKLVPEAHGSSAALRDCAGRRLLPPQSAHLHFPAAYKVSCWDEKKVACLLDLPINIRLFPEKYRQRLSKKVICFFTPSQPVLYSQSTCVFFTPIQPILYSQSTCFLLPVDLFFFLTPSQPVFYSQSTCRVSMFLYSQSACFLLPGNQAN